MLKINQRETKLFVFSRDTNREELKIRKNNVNLQWLCNNDFTGMVLLQWLCCNGFVLIVRVSPACLFTNKTTSFINDYTGKYRPVTKDF